MSLCYRLILVFIIVVIELPLELVVVVVSSPASRLTGGSSGRSGRWRRRRIIRRLGSSIVRGG